MSKWAVDDLADQSGRVVLITGANSGLGLASAEALAGKGATVLLACRNPDKGEAALEQVRSAATGRAPSLVQLDLADLASVRRCAAVVADTTDRLDVLMNNAGVMAIPKRATADGFEAQLGTNHLGHFALTGLVLALLRAADDPRVVTTSSGFHKAGTMHWDDLNLDRRYNPWVAYAQSKLANLLFAFELDRRAASAGAMLTSVAAHPGFANTHLQAVGPQMTGNRLMARTMDLGNSLLAQSAEAGALPQIRAAAGPAVRSGEYYGPDGIGEMRGAPVLVKAKKAAYDAESGRRLWDRSQDLTRVTYDWS